VYRELLCQRSFVMATRQGMSFQPRIFEVIHAFYAGKAYCAQEHCPDCWHGYPVGWKEVPPALRQQWTKAGLVKRRDIQQYWESHT